MQGDLRLAAGVAPGARPTVVGGSGAPSRAPRDRPAGNLRRRAPPPPCCSQTSPESRSSPPLAPPPRWSNGLTWSAWASSAL
ncbi:MAG: hypothetical protein DIU79_11640, partial [Actinobacteria bacterium]